MRQILTIFFSACLQIIPLLCSAQCGNSMFFHTYENVDVTTDPSSIYEKNSLKYNSFQKNYNTTTTISVVFHVIHDNAQGSIFSETDADNAINYLNGVYPSSINFCKAGVNQVFHPLLTNYRHQYYEGTEAKSDEVSLKNLSRWDTRKYLNIWIVNDITNQRCAIDDPYDLFGWATYPNAHGTSLDGIIIEKDRVNIPNPDPDSDEPESTTLAHEIGHCLGLLHPGDPFDLTLSGNYFDLCNDNPCNNVCFASFLANHDNCIVDNTNCSKKNDLVCDTPPIPSGAQNIFNSSCMIPTGVNVCSNTAIPNNMMNEAKYFSGSDCRAEFTVQQIERMQACLNTLRSTLSEGECELNESIPQDITLLSPYGGEANNNPNQLVMGTYSNQNQIILPGFPWIRTQYPMEEYKVGEIIKFYWWQSESPVNPEGRNIEISVSFDGGTVYSVIDQFVESGSGVKEHEWTVEPIAWIVGGSVNISEIEVLFKIRDMQTFTVFNGDEEQDISGVVKISDDCDDQIFIPLYPVSNDSYYLQNDLTVEYKVASCSSQANNLKPQNSSNYKSIATSTYSLDLYLDNTFIQTIATNIPENNGEISYTWNIPYNLSLISENAQIKATRTDDPSISAFSEVFFIKGYDFCVGAVDVPLSSTPCDNSFEEKLFYLDGATVTDIDPSCGLPIAVGDVYGKITVPSSGNLDIQAKGAFGTLGLAVYSDCDMATAIELACEEATVPSVSLTGLTPGSDVFVRLWYSNYTSTSTSIITLCAYEPNSVVVPDCSDGIQNGYETGIDCGGNCPTCPQAEIISPNGNQLLQAGSSENVLLSIPSNISQFILSYSPDGGNTWISPTDAGFNTSYTNDGTGMVSWNIPCFYFDNNGNPQSFSSSNSVIGIFDASIGFPNGLLDQSDNTFGFNECNSSGFDLAVYNFFVSTNQAEQGDVVDVQVEVKNVGTIPINTSYNTTLRITTLNNQGCNDNGTLLDTKAGINLWPGQSDFLSFSVAIPSNLQDGNYVFKVRADGDNQILENSTSESNNCAIANITVADPASAFTDVIVQNSSISTTTAIPNGQFSSTVTVKNNGGLPANGVDVFFYLSNDNILDNSDQWLQNADAGDIAAGQSSTVTAQITLPPNAYSGNKKIIIVADGNNDVFESNELNNEATHTISYSSVADLIPNDFYLSSIKNYRGGSTTYEIDVENIGTATSSSSDIKFYISTNTTYNSSDIYCGSKSISSISSGNELQKTGSITIPTSVTPGAKYLLAVVNSSQSASEFDYDNNVIAIPIEILPFCLTIETTPASCGGNDGTASAVVDGGSGSFSYSWSPVNSSSSSISNLSPGIYTVTATNGSYSQTETAYVTDNGGVIDLEWLSAETIEGSNSTLDYLSLSTYQVIDNSAYMLFTFKGEMTIDGVTYQSTGVNSPDLILTEIDGNGSFNVIKHYQTELDNSDFEMVGLKMSRNSLGEFVIIIGFKTFTAVTSTSFNIDGQSVTIGKYYVNFSTIEEKTVVFIHTNASGNITSVKSDYLYPDNFYYYGDNWQQPSIYYNYLGGSNLLALNDKFYYSTKQGPLNSGYLPLLGPTTNISMRTFTFLLDGNFTYYTGTAHPTAYVNAPLVPGAEYSYLFPKQTYSNDESLFIYYRMCDPCVGGGGNSIYYHSIQRYGVNNFIRDLHPWISVYNLITGENYLFAYIRTTTPGVDLGSGYISNGGYQLLKLSKTNGTTIDVIDLSAQTSFYSSNSSNQIFYYTGSNSTSYINVMDDEGNFIANAPYIALGPSFVKMNDNNTISVFGYYEDNATFDSYNLTPSVSGYHYYHSILGIGTNEAFTLELEPSSVKCSGSSIMLDVGVSEPGMTYLWSPGGNTTQTKTTSSTGTYTCTVTDANGCSATTSTEVVNNDLSVSLDYKTNENCNDTNGEIAVNINGSYPPFSIQWSNGVQGDNKISNLNSGNYTCTVTDALGCVKSYSTSISNVGGNGPVISVTESMATCGQSNGSLHAGVLSGGVAPFSYTWSNGMNGADIYNLSTGSYIVTVTDINGCTANSTKIVNEYQGISSIDFTNIEHTSCLGNDGEATLSHQGGSGPFTYQWSNGVSNATATGLQLGWHFVQIIDGMGCSQIDSVYIASLIDDAYILSENITNSNCGEGGAINLNMVYSQSVQLQFQWSNGETTEDIDDLSPGVYEVEITFGQNCSIIKQYTIIDNPSYNQLVLSSVSTPSDCITPTGTASVIATGGDGNYTYQWDATANNQIGSQANSLYSGLYTCTVTSGNCQEEIEVFIPGSEELLLSGTNYPSYCNLNNGQATVEVLGGTPPFTFQWNDSNNQNTQTAFGLSPSNYTVTVTDGNGCQNSISTFVDSLNTFAIDITTTDDYCSTGVASAIVEPLGGYAPYTISWNDGWIGSFRDNLSEGSYTVTVIDGFGCMAIDSFTIISVGDITLSHSTTNETCLADDGTISLIVNGGVPPYQYFWSTGDSTNFVSGLQTGTYSVYVVDSLGCSQYEVVEVFTDNPLGVTIDTLQDATCAAADGEITISVSGGASPISILWSTGATGNTLSSVTTGLYDFLVEDANGCQLFREVYISSISSGDTDLDGVCDDLDICNGGNDLIDDNSNGTPDDCEPVEVSIKVMLEGAYDASTGLMRTNLSSLGLIPLNHPYNVAPYNYNGSEYINSLPANMVDWILVTARTGLTNASDIETKVGLLLENGDIVSTDGVSPLVFDLDVGDNYHFVVRHRNHLDIMTANMTDRNIQMNYDFTTAINMAGGPFQQGLLSNGKVGMFAGDINQDLTIQITDISFWLANPAVLNTYNNVDLNLDGHVQVSDHDTWFPNKAKLGNPDVAY